MASVMTPDGQTVGLGEKVKYGKVNATVIAIRDAGSSNVNLRLANGTVVKGVPFGKGKGKWS
jgi:hypothetical protein|tara:strand:- start:23 stop:208 length:186 start_codon:yes stop_codon:yes gene_type:complete